MTVTPECMLVLQDDLNKQKQPTSVRHLLVRHDTSDYTH